MRANQLQSLAEVGDLARRRLQKQGELVKSGGFWKGRWREDVRLEGGGIARKWSPRVMVAPAEGRFGVTKREAQRMFWDTYLSRLDDNNLVPRSMETFGRFAAGHYDRERLARLRRPASPRLCLARLPEWFARLRLRDVTKADVQRACDELLAAGLAPGTARNTRVAVHALFEFAAEEGFHAGRNPARGVRIPQGGTRETRALSYPEARALLDGLQHRAAKDITACALMTGCRVSEIAGLEWGRVNLGSAWKSDGGTIVPPRSAAVVEQWYRGAAGPLKTASSQRVVPLPGPLAAILGKRRDEAPAGSAYVFEGPRGRPWEVGSLARCYLKPAAAAAGVGRVHWHALRHTHATWLFQMGMSEPDRKAQLGHAAPGVHAGYLHLRLEDRREPLERLAAALFGPDPEPEPEPTAADLAALEGYFA